MSTRICTIPIEDGFKMPGEFEPHLGTLMIYPTRPGSWGKDRTDALKAVGEVYKEILKREKLYLLVSSDYLQEARAFTDEILGSMSECVIDRQTARDRLCIMEMDSDDAWARDVGPTFVTDRKGSIRGINWSFNAWGGEVDGLYATWDKDDAVASGFCGEAGYEFYDAAPFVLEGGSIHSDGEGTLLVTERCLLSKGRNPEMSRQEIEDTLCRYLGAEKVLWLPYGIYNDETNEHVDNVCAFIKPGEVVLAWTDDRNDPQYDMSFADLEYLEGITDAKGRRIIVHKLPVPQHPVLVSEEDLENFEFEEGEDTREAGERLAASYVNFYFVNGAALVPQFGGDNRDSDRKALEILKGLLPDREVIGIDARAILLGGGNIHCMTQQIPAQ
jgi:agmatine deiminase